MKIAKFFKISYEQFVKDYQILLGNEDEKTLKTLYDDVILPKRATKASAGYDFVSPISFTLKPNETIQIPTAITCQMLEGYVLNIYPRSSLGRKYQMALLNTVGIIDADYYYADNEGHIIIGIINRSNIDMVINAGDRFVQGVFLAYYTAEEDEVLNKRVGGFGSTN